jgi:hypothetical protein
MVLVRRSSRPDRARPDIRRTKLTWSWTGYGEVVRLTQGSPPVLSSKVARDDRKPTRRGDPEARRGRGWQIHGEYRRDRADEALVTAWRIKP